MTDTRSIRVGEVSNGPLSTGTIGTPVSLPVVDVLTGRGFITGKSGSGKSNTASVVIERLLDGGYGCLIVDTDGEYYGLKEQFELLHVGADDECDLQVSAEHAERLADLALDRNVPIILDVSGFLDEGEATELVREVARHLFTKEKKRKQPFLMLVEECHEYIPEGGGLGETGKMLIKIAKRGRKHGLGIVGISQRPADVKKDFITQCDWLVWHRLTWRNDTKVVGRILGSEYADAVDDLGDGEGFLSADWMRDIQRVQFDRKETFDAGATPGLDDFERPDLKELGDDLSDELAAISTRQQERRDELDRLRKENERLRDDLEATEEKLAHAREVNIQLDGANIGLGDVDAQATLDSMDVERMDVAKAGDGLSDTEAAVVADLKDERDEFAERVDELEIELADLRDEYEAVVADRDDLREEVSAFDSWREDRATVVETIEDLAEHLDADVAVPDDLGEQPDGTDETPSPEGETPSPIEFLELDVVSRAVDRAAADGSTSRELVMDTLIGLTEGAPATYADLADRLDVGESTVRGRFGPLREWDLVERVGEGRPMRWRLATESVTEIRERLDRTERLEKLTSS
jgi:DNA-binding transcriptional ArsR family regulator